MISNSLRLTLTLTTTLGLGGLATAQFSSVGPFTGNASEGFETQDTSGGAFPVCVVDRVFGNQADLCAANGSGGAHITGGWGFGCSIQEQEGSRLFGCTNGPALYTFDTPVSRFGGYFGTNNPGASDGSIDFLDGSGAVLFSDTITAPNDCTWTWNGWDSGGAAVSAVRVQSNYSSGGYMMMDGMQADFGPVTPGNAFCFCDGSGTLAPCGNTGAAGSGCANSADANGGLLSATGLASISAPTLAFNGTGLVPGQPGLYFQGDNSLNGGLGVVFGDGLRCAGGNILRLEILSADASGNSQTSVDIVAAQSNPLNAGDVRSYQLWYRDPAGSPCGSAFNLTNGVEITWVP